MFAREGSSWSPEYRFIPPEGVVPYDTGGPQCGSAVGIAGDTVVVGARYDWEETLPSSGLGLSNRPGSAYVIERGAGGWSQAAKLRPLAGVRERDDNSIAEFGREVAISADAQLVAVGSPRDVTYGASPGSAHSFRRNGSSWVTEQKLVALLPRAPSKLSGGQWGCGERVAVSGADVLIGCTSAESGGRACLYQFVDPAWDVRLKLLAVAP